MDVLGQIQSLENEVTKTQIASETALAEGQMAERLGQVDAQIADQNNQLQQDQLALESSLGKEARRLQALGIELDGIRAIADNANAQERNAIQRFVAEKEPANVQYLNEIASKFGKEAAKKFVLGTDKSGGIDRDNSSIITTARTFADSDFQMGNPIPGVDPANTDGTYAAQQYFDYHYNNILRTVAGTTTLPANASGTNTQPANTRAYSPTSGLAPS